jgi:tetratricopeptide (TPR) repeat protein
VEDDPGALTLLGRSLVEQGKPAEAARALKRAVALSPAAVPAHFWLVQAYRNSGRYDLAREELDVLHRLAPRAAAAVR